MTELRWEDKMKIKQIEVETAKCTIEKVRFKRVNLGKEQSVKNGLALVDEDGKLLSIQETLDIAKELNQYLVMMDEKAFKSIRMSLDDATTVSLNEQQSEAIYLKGTPIRSYGYVFLMKNKEETTVSYFLGNPTRAQFDSRVKSKSKNGEELAYFVESGNALHDRGRIMEIFKDKRVGKKLMTYELSQSDIEQLVHFQPIKKFER